jgi:hypothetical protein
MSASELIAAYRLYAAYCIEIAQERLEPDRKLALLTMGQAWARLADQIEKHGGAGLQFAAPGPRTPEPW